MKKRGFDQDAFDHILGEYKMLNLSTKLQLYVYMRNILGPQFVEYEKLRDKLYEADMERDAMVARIKELEEMMDI